MFIPHQYVRLAPTHYGVKHEPLRATAFSSKKREGQNVTFIGKQLCFFENDGYIPTVGETVEVMISRPIFGRYTEVDIEAARRAGGVHLPTEGSLNRNRLTAVLVRTVEPDKHQLMAIDGFECAGTMCRTTTRAIITDGSQAFPKTTKWDKYGEPISLTPGRCGIREANNVNAGLVWKQAFQELIPTNVYVEKALLEERKTMFYISGMTRVEDCYYRDLFKI
jgi:hypothetical protein